MVVHCLCTVLVGSLALLNREAYKFERQIYISSYLDSKTFSLLRSCTLNLEAALKVEPSRESRQCCMWGMVKTWAKAKKF